MNKTIIQTIHNRIQSICNQEGFDKRGCPSFTQGFTQNKHIGILIVAGFDDTTFVMQEIANICMNKGYTVYSVSLPGMGCSVDLLGSTSWEEWIKSVKEDYMLLSKLVEKVFVIGFSTGATVILRVMEQFNKNNLISGAILLSPAIFFVNPLFPIWFQKFIMNIYKLINPYPKKLNNRQRIFLDLKARLKYDDGKKRTSIQAVIELFNLVKKTKREIHKIRVPILTIHSKKDIVTHHHSSTWLYKNVKSNIKKHVLLKKSGHPLMVDTEKKIIFKLTKEFIKQIINNNVKHS